MNHSSLSPQSRGHQISIAKGDTLQDIVAYLEFQDYAPADFNNLFATADITVNEQVVGVVNSRTCIVNHDYPLLIISVPLEPGDTDVTGIYDLVINVGNTTIANSTRKEIFYEGVEIR